MQAMAEHIEAPKRRLASEPGVMTPKRKIYPATPGPRNCLRTSGNTRACEKCGCTPAVLHTPIRAAGRFCAECCPHCSLPFGTPSGRLEAKP